MIILKNGMAGSIMTICPFSETHIQRTVCIDPDITDMSVIGKKRARITVSRSVIFSTEKPTWD